MLQVEATGKNIEAAIENALFELKAVREDVDIKILEEGGFFKKAKVFVSISEDEIEKYKKRQQSRQSVLNQEEQLLKEETQIVEQQTKTDVVNEESKENFQEEIEKTEVCENKAQTNVSNKETNKTSDEDKAVNFVKELLNKFSLSYDLDVETKKDEVFINITNATDIIGYRGEGLNALQYLTSVVVCKNNRHAKKIRIDCDNYRSRREESLVALAHRLAKKVESTGTSAKLEPMSAYERRIIHSALADNESVETVSKGEEPHRYLVVSLKNK